MVVTRTVLAAVLSGVAFGAAAQAQPNPSLQFPKTEVVAPPPLSVNDFVRYPAIASPVLSNNGKYFAATAPINGRMNLVVIDLETRKANALTNFSNFDVIAANWVGNDRILYTLGQFNTPTGPGQADGGGLFVISRDGSLRRTELRKASGSTHLDGAALRAVSGVGRFPPVPGELGGPEVTFEIPIVFRLSGE